MVNDSTSTIGLIPAAGTGSRLGELPFSKELMPIATHQDSSSRKNVVTAIENAVAALVANDITRQHVVIAPGKWDIPAYLGDGKRFDADIAYHLAHASPSVPHSLDAAFPFTAGCNVVLLFPDIVFRPRAALGEILDLRLQGKADVVLALVPSERGDKVDLVSMSEDGRVASISAKPGAGTGGWTWVCACWGETFTAFMHDYLADPVASRPGRGNTEIYVADILNASIKDGLRVHAVRFADGEAIDIGTPDDLARAWARGPMG